MNSSPTMVCPSSVAPSSRLAGIYVEMSFATHRTRRDFYRVASSAEGSKDPASVLSDYYLIL